VAGASRRETFPRAARQQRAIVISAATGAPSRDDGRACDGVSAWPARQQPGRAGLVRSISFQAGHGFSAAD